MKTIKEVKNYIVMRLNSLESLNENICEDNDYDSGYIDGTIHGEIEGLINILKEIDYDKYCFYKEKFDFVEENNLFNF